MAKRRPLDPIGFGHECTSWFEASFAHFVYIIFWSVPRLRGRGKQSEMVTRVLA
jgi:hypothetical protein